MARTPEGPPPPPAVQKLRVRYAKRGRLRFTSHRDIQRSLERALRRADIPMAYSAGFSPHPKVSYAGAAPTGTASEAEYLEISVTARCDPAAVRDGAGRVDARRAGRAGGRRGRPRGNLVERLEASSLADRAARRRRTTRRGRPSTTFLAAPEVSGAADDEERSAHLRRPRRRCTPSTVDRPAEPRRADDASPGADCAILRAVVRHTTPAVRPDDVLTALRVVADLVPPSAPRVTRLAQGPLDGATGAVSDPLEPDRS